MFLPPFASRNAPAKQTNIIRRRLISHGGSSSQLGFFVKTGGELDWRDATAYATSKEGLKVLFSGSEAVIACGIGLLIIAMPIHGFAYRAFGAFLGAIGDNILSGSWSPHVSGQCPIANLLSSP